MGEKLLSKIEDNFVRYKDKLAIIQNNKEITYHQLYVRTLETVNMLKQMGIEKNTKVLLSIEDSYDFITIWIALWMCKAVPIPLETKVTDNEIRYAVESGICQFIFADRQISSLTDDLIQRSEKFFTQYICYKTVYVIDDSRDDIALFFYTSGTTGLPKCVMFSHQAMYNSIVSLCTVAKMDSGDVFLTPISPFLPASLATAVLPSLVLGATLIISNSALPGKLLRMINDYHVTVFFAVPFVYKNMLIAMENRERMLFQSVRLWLTSSANMESRVYDEYYYKYNICIHSIYCSSECGAITYNSSQNIDEIKKSVGKTFDGVYIKIINENGKEVRLGETGEIVVSGKSIFSGYYQKEDLMKQVLSGNWVRTGDLGSVDQNGFVRLEGRISDTINIAGYLVNPSEVENTILTNSDISDVLVYAKTNENEEDIIAAKVILKNGSDVLDYDDFYAYCSKYLSSYKIPRCIEIVTSINSGRYGKKKR